MFCEVLLHAVSHYLTHILVWECIPRQISFLTGHFESGEKSLERFAKIGFALMVKKKEKIKKTTRCLLSNSVNYPETMQNKCNVFPFRKTTLPVGRRKLS